MKKIKKIILIICFISVLFVAGGFLFLRFGGYLFIDKADREHFVNEMKNSPPLPERFYEIYDIIYPDALGSSTLGSYFYNQLSDGFNRECPCAEATYSGIYGRYLGAGLRLISFTLDDDVSQRECLNFYTAKIDFLHGNKGIEKLSKSYFDKDVYSLNDREIIEVIVTMKNPNLYNRKRRPERVEAAVNQIFEKLNK